MIILLQSVTFQFHRLFSQTSYHKVRQSNFITKSDRLFLQSVSGIKKCDSYYKLFYKSVYKTHRKDTFY